MDKAIERNHKLSYENLNIQQVSHFFFSCRNPVLGFLDPASSAETTQLAVRVRSSPWHLESE